MRPSPLLAFVPNGPRPGVGREQADIGALVHRLEAAQWRSPEEIAARQFEALAKLAGHMGRESPLFRRQLDAAGLAPHDLGTQEGLHAFPPIRRRDLQGPPKDVFCATVPDACGEIVHASSSGSTGEPVRLRRTALDQLLFRAMTIRFHLWHGIGTGLSFCQSRAGVDEVVSARKWGGTAGMFWPTGPMLAMPNQLAITEQARLIEGFQPDILLIYPSNIVALARHYEANGKAPFTVRQIRTTSETLPDPDRALVERMWGCAPVDVYSSTEVGYIAMQCPQSGLYHVMAETLIVEVIDDAGRPCREGEVGRIVVTDLNNHATPLIRYAIGDHAEVGPPCPCGRGLPTLRRILGRERNLVTMPDGSRHWPLTGRSRYRDVAPVLQHQMLQRERDRIEVRLVIERPLTDGEEAALRAIMQQALGHPFALDFEYYEHRLPMAPNGKFEEFVNLIDG
ncbi:phenylacetate--CoA ligase family protein [Sphingomonas sp. CGMCC 1.13654]|uniref:Phenylacetate--CoA ligase family protein n=1 Tax=Sphingomonas chungangi TaxID=2683589 RepID=A0A838L4J9_9SPHN|nr:phenylacetate--CoA ligase family protein [Sphingomonas chungangi]MBA2933136.1 phenylacetate--CoA ligase family protein [Sphingomonas chungangi]MVW56756.1 hypothetical protein [Sphingomonas chungangi]